MKKSILSIFTSVCLCVVFSTSGFAQVSNICITITTGWCTAVGAGGPPYFTSSNLNWVLTNQTVTSSIEYDYRMGGCGYAYPRTNGGFTFAVIDTLTGFVWQSHNSGVAPFGDKFGNYHCLNQAADQNGFDFSVSGLHPGDAYNPLFNTISWTQTISTFLDSIPTGCLLIMYAVSLPPWRSIDTNLVNKLASMGATGLRNLCIDTGPARHTPAPYIFWAVKGDSSYSGQLTGHDYNTPLTLSFCPHGAHTTTHLSDIFPSDFHVFPNPSTGSFTLTADRQYIGEEFSIFDYLGRKIKSSIISKEKENIDISDIDPGMYTLMINQRSIKLMVSK